jgi:hypothetical protein
MKKIMGNNEDNRLILGITSNWVLPKYRKLQPILLLSSTMKTSLYLFDLYLLTFLQLQQVYQDHLL